MDIIVESKFRLEDHQPIFFDRPVTNLYKKNIGILVGSNTNIYEVQQVYTIIQAMNHNPVLIADETLRHVGLPADIYLSKQNRLGYQNSEEAIARINDCHSLVAGIGLELNSSMQLLLDKIIRTYRGLIVLTESSFKLPGIKDSLASNMLLIGSTKKLLALGKMPAKVKSSGLSLKIESLHNFASRFKGGLVCVEDFQILGIESEGNRAAVINSKNSVGQEAFMAILVSLLSDKGESAVKDWQKYFLAAGFLYKQYYQIEKNPLLLKDFLQDQF